MRIEAYAKLNFTLEVFGVRTDGYHALRSVVVPISLADVIEIEPSNRLTSDTGYVDDLCLKAARVLDPTRGATIRVAKRIPAGGGLGGGSADAAAVLLALNEMWGLMYTPAELAEIGAQVGSDVPALVRAHASRNAVLMEGRGERVMPFELPRAYDVVLAFPGVFSSTPEVYAACTGRTTNDPSILSAFRTAVAADDLPQISRALTNDLQAPAVSCHHEIAAALEALKAAGAIGAALTGSGSTVFALAESPARAEAIVARLTEAGYAARSARTLCGRTADESDGR